MKRLFLLMLLGVGTARAEWPGWRGDGSGVSQDGPLPLTWSASENVLWKTAIPGEGASSPIVWGERVFLTAAEKDGTRRLIHCLDRRDGKRLWSRAIEHADPELTSAVTGHAAATPVSDGQRVVASFGNAGVVCCGLDGKLLWQHRVEAFDSELGIASSPILCKDRVILVCDHDGKQPQSFDSYLLCLELASGKVVWKTDRPGLFRSWSTPLLAGDELIVNGQDELRGYDAASGKLLWQAEGMTGWVAPSPVAGHGLVFAASGKAGPVLAVWPGGRGNVGKTRVEWRHETGGPYVCSPILVGDHLYVQREDGILTCREARTGKPIYQERLVGKYLASAVAGDGKLYFINEDGLTTVVQAGPKFQVLARNALKESAVASPAIAGGQLFVRTEKHLWCIGRR